MPPHSSAAAESHAHDVWATTEKMQARAVKTRTSWSDPIYPMGTQQQRSGPPGRDMADIADSIGLITA